MGIFDDIDPQLLQGLDMNKAAQNPGFMQKLQGLLGSGPDDPQSQGLLGLASAMLQASGPSTMPTSFGQALGKGIEGYSKGRQQGTENQLMAGKIKAGQGSPSTVQEWQYYNSLTPEDQARFLEMKRSQQWLNLGGEYVKPGMGGGAEERMPVTPKPEQMPAFKAAQTAAETQAKISTESRETSKNSLGDTLDEVNKMRDAINGLTQSPGFDTAYGLSGKVDPRNYIPGTDASNTSARREQLDAMSFGVAIQKMKGFGSLSEAEGKKVSAAFTRATNPKIDQQEARNAWSEVLQMMDTAERRAYEKSGGKAPARKTNNAQSSGVRKFNPQTGRIE